MQSSKKTRVGDLERFIIGGVGGFLPVVMFLVAVDWEKTFASAGWLTVAGYCVRVTGLFLVGGFVAYLHRDEKNLFKLFEFGIGAPALVAGLITAYQVPPTTTASSASGSVSSLSISIIDTALAQTNSSDLTLRHFTLPRPTATQEFLKGLVGQEPANIWFVIVGSFADLENAKRQADSINSSNQEFKAEVYAPYGDNPHYLVVIGSHLTQSEARELRDKAIHTGLPPDSYFKTFPNLPPAP